MTDCPGPSEGIEVVLVPVQVTLLHPLHEI